VPTTHVQHTAANARFRFITLIFYSPSSIEKQLFT